MKIIGSDFDGTLYINQEVSKEVLQAIKLWQNQGHLFGLVTGRDYWGMKAKLETIDLKPDFIISNTGGVIDGIASQYLLNSFFENEKIYIEAGYSKEITIFSERETYSVRDTFNEKISRDMSSKIPSINLKGLKKLKKVTQISFKFETIRLAQSFTERVNKNKEWKGTAFQNNHGVDIVPLGISKAEGLTRLLTEINSEPDQLIVIGDGQNDCSMLAAYRSYTLETASNSAKNEAEKIVSNVATMIYQELE